MACRLPNSPPSSPQILPATTETGLALAGLRAIAVLFLFLILIVMSRTGFAANSVVVESKTFAPGQTACSVGVFVTNDVGITGFVLPLELRTLEGGAYITGPFPSSFKFTVVIGNRLSSSPLGPASDFWPAAFTTTSRFASPAESGEICGGPMSSTYVTATSTVDGVSPDGVFHATVASGDPNIGESIELEPGSDPVGTANASILFVFNVDTVPGCFKIDTCCRAPANHLIMVALDQQGFSQLAVPVDFDRGLISVGEDGCSRPADNHRPTAICRDTFVVVADSSCSAAVTPDDVDSGSWDVEDGTDLYKTLDPPGPYRIGTNDVRLFVCDRDGECSSCPVVIVVEDLITPRVAVEVDTVYFRFTGDLPFDTICREITLSKLGCAAIPIASAQDGWLIDANFVGPFSHRTGLRICLNLTLANNAPNGMYEDALELRVLGGGATDTVFVIIELNHPPVEPGCDTVCGFVYSMEGEAIQGARVAALTCVAPGIQCEYIPGSADYTGSDGAFCVIADGWPNLAVSASAAGYAVGTMQVSVCDDQPVYIYLYDWGYGFPGGGQGDAGPGVIAPSCATHGFVFGPGDLGLPLTGARVELWDSYPDGSIIATDSTDAFGHFGLGMKSGDAVFKADGFCPKVVWDISCAYTAMEIVLDSVPFTELPNWPYFTDYYSTSAQSVSGGVPYPIAPGDVIYATDPQGVVCGATWVQEDGTYLIHVLGDDADTQADEGASDGDSITLWLNCVCAVTAQNAWANFGSFQFDAIWDCEPEEQCCTLCEGWNMWSYNIQVPGQSRTEVLATIDLHYDALRSGLCDYGSISWFAGRPINDLQNVPPWYGYDIHMLQEDTVCLEGDPVDPATPIQLCAGWNYIPYLPSSTDNLSHALQTLSGNYIHIFTMYCDYGAASWNATRPINDLDCLEPCHGYWIEMLADDTLVYPEPSGCSQLAKRSAWSPSGRLTATPLIADYFAAASTLAEGSVISVRTGAGMLIGESYVGPGGSFLVHAYGDVPSTPEIEGAMHGEALAFEIDGAAAATEQDVRWADRDNRAVVFVESAESVVPTAYALHQNYPNPFNAGTVISFDLTGESDWTLSIYNVMGQQVRDFNGVGTAGRTRVRWDGRSETGQPLASGVYFYRLSANGFTDFKKMMLVK